MARGRGSSRGGNARPRRPMDWIKGEIDSSQAGLAYGTPVCKWLCDPEQLRHEFTDPTLMATRVMGMVRAETGAIISDSTVFAAGLIAWNFTTDGAGASVHPSECPRLLDIECQDEDWIWTWYAPFVNGSSPSQVIASGNHDSKARRRLGNDSGLLFVVQTFGSPPVNFHYHFHARCLIKE